PHATPVGRTVEVTRAEGLPERIPPHSLIVIGHKDSAGRANNQYDPPVFQSATHPAEPTVAENGAPVPPLQTPERPAQHGQVAIPRTAPPPESRWEHPAPVAPPPLEHHVAIQPEQHRPQPDVPRHVETPVA